MARIVVVFLFIFFLFISSCKSPTAPQGNTNTDQIGAHTDNWNSPLVTELDSIIYKLDGTSPSLGNNDLQPLAFLGNAKIVGLGEATHGTKEFFQMKHRIFKYLVENFGFKVFAFEADMGESVYIDRYITKGEGNLKDIIENKMIFWTWRTPEVENLLEWMRQVNSGKPDADKLHYIGVDCQAMIYQPNLIIEYLNKYKPELVSSVEPIFNSIRRLNNTDITAFYDNYRLMAPKRNQEIADSLNEMLNKIEAASGELISKSSQFEYDTMKRLALNMIQANNTIYEVTHTSSGNIRDKNMADNALWASNLFGADKKIALWAHNYHIAKIDTLGIESMGGFLKCYIQGQYQNICFSFSKGYFTAVTQADSEYYGTHIQLINIPPLKNSLNYIFYNAKYDNFILKTNEIPDATELGKFIIGLKPFIQVGANYSGDPNNYYAQCDLKSFIDVLINIDITNYAEQLGYELFKVKPIDPELYSSYSF